MNEYSDEPLNIREEFDNRFFKLRAVTKEYLISCDSTTVPDSKSLMNISKQANNCGIKLPAINLPTFDGNYLNWRSFEVSFSAFVGQNDSLTNIHKLCYLRSQLKGDAWNLIKSHETTDENYKIAFNLVKGRFNNHRRIIYSHVNAILNSKFENAKSFINTIDQHVQGAGIKSTFEKLSCINSSFDIKT